MLPRFVRRRVHVRGASAVLCAALLLGGCAGLSERETAGTVLGGATGALVGHQFGKGTGRTVATALGAIIGATAGREIGRSLDATSQQRAGDATVRALEGADVGAGIAWENPANAGAPARGATTIMRQGADGAGRTCREFQQTVTIGGEVVRSYGTACRDGNGQWQLLPG